MNRRRGWTLAGVPVVIVLGPGCADAPAQDAGGDEPPLVMTATLSHTAYSRTFPRSLTLKIDLAAAALPRSGQRAPLNLALVIDRSGSMAHDNKFDYAMQAAQLVVENLSCRDIVSVIAFNQESVVLSPAGPAVNPEFLNHRLDEITPQGWTNLSAGLVEAFAQINQRATATQMKRVIVLTDGQANQGITDPHELRKLVASARRRGIGVSTMGCGDDVDEAVLIALADAGRGRYTDIRESDDIPEAMAAELHGLLGVVAQNVRVEVTALDALDITAVHGRRLARPTDSFVFDLGDVREGERTVLLARLEPHDILIGEVSGIECTVSFDRTDISVRQHQVARVAAIALDDTDAELVRRSANRGVALYADVTFALELAENAVLNRDGRGSWLAAELFVQHYETARSYALQNRDQQLLNQAFMLKHFMTELAAADEAGLLHDDDRTRRSLARRVAYRRYMRRHHAP
jgi:Ca-activated chloride channel family protein